MLSSEKDRLAAELAKRYSAFEAALFRDQRSYRFRSSYSSGRQAGAMPN